MKELCNKLSLVKNIVNDSDAERVFGEIARELMTNYQVSKNNSSIASLRLSSTGIHRNILTKVYIQDRRVKDIGSFIQVEWILRFQALHQTAMVVS